MDVAELRIQVNCPEMDRNGLNVSDVREFVEIMLGGKQVSEMVEGERRINIAVRSPESYRNNIDAFGNRTCLPLTVNVFLCGKWRN